MKNKKKGYTLIEVVIAIVLMIVIGTITVVSIKSKDNKEEEKFKEKVISSATVYLEEYYLKGEQLSLKEPNDFIYLQFKDLVHNGLLSEETKNPYNSLLLNNSLDDCLKVYVDDNYMINIEYPVENNNCSKTPQIHLINNNDSTNTLYLKDTKDILAKYNNDIEVLEKIKNGEIIDEVGYFKNIEGTWNDPGIVLTDFKGNIISISSSDWEKSSDWDYNKREWVITYKINPSGPSNILDKESIQEVSRIVKLNDDSGPMLLNRNSYEEYNGQEISCEDNCTNNDNWFLFDNYDGIKEKPFREINILEVDYNKLIFTKTKKFFDNNENKSKEYNINFKSRFNNAPEISFADQGIYIPYSININYLEEKIDCIDSDGDDCTISLELYNPSGVKETSLTKKLSVIGEYTLNVTAKDNYGAESKESYNIYIYNAPEVYYTGDNVFAPGQITLDYFTKNIKCKSKHNPECYVLFWELTNKETKEYYNMWVNDGDEISKTGKYELSVVGEDEFHGYYYLAGKTKTDIYINNRPEVYYTGGSIFEPGEVNLEYFKNNIFCDDIDGDECSFNYFIYNITGDVGTISYDSMYSNLKTVLNIPGKYELNMEVCDHIDCNYDYIEFEIVKKNTPPVAYYDGYGGFNTGTVNVGYFREHIWCEDEDGDECQLYFSINKSDEPYGFDSYSSDDSIINKSGIYSILIEARDGKEELPSLFNYVIEINDSSYEDYHPENYPAIDDWCDLQINQDNYADCGFHNCVWPDQACYYKIPIEGTGYYGRGYDCASQYCNFADLNQGRFCTGSEKDINKEC